MMRRHWLYFFFALLLHECVLRSSVVTGAGGTVHRYLEEEAVQSLEQMIGIINMVYQYLSRECGLTSRPMSQQLLRTRSNLWTKELA